MRRLAAVVWVLVVALVATPAVPVQAQEMGVATMTFDVDPGLDPSTVEQTIRNNVQIVGVDGAPIPGAEVSVTVENGVATVTASNVPVGTTVQAALPAQVASSIGAGAVGTLAAGGAGGTGVSTGAAIGAGVLVTVGVVAGTYVALDDDDDEERMSPDGSTNGP